MKQQNSANGKDLKEMFAAATNWLEKSAPDIDALNVFPVPDGDTGTNMLLTMRSSVEEAYRAPDRSASAVAEAMARGALMGARGNSGVIMSQIWRGLAMGLAEKDEFTGTDLAAALLLASNKAYNGLSNPVEGTILTVIREAASAAQAQVASGSDDLISVMEAVVDTARESVANTPTLLPVLREAGLVNSRRNYPVLTLVMNQTYYASTSSTRDELVCRPNTVDPRRGIEEDQARDLRGAGRSRWRAGGK